MSKYNVLDNEEFKKIVDDLLEVVSDLSRHFEVGEFTEEFKGCRLWCALGDSLTSNLRGLAEIYIKENETKTKNDKTNNV